MWAPSRARNHPLPKADGTLKPMSKRFVCCSTASVLVLLCLSGKPVFSNNLPDDADLKAGPIQGEVFPDVGCVLRARGSGWEAPPIFMDTIAGPPVTNIGGQDIILKRVEDVKDSNKPEYHAGDFHVQVIYGTGINGEGGSVYKHAKIIVTRNGQKTTTKAEGNCGC